MRKLVAVISASLALRTMFVGKELVPLPTSSTTISGYTISPGYSEMMAMREAVRLHTGQYMPMIGLGTWMGNKEAMKAAINIGYRHIDTAQSYGNEEQLGEALVETIIEGKLKREDMFITTKLSPVAMAPQNVRIQTELSLKRLKTDYVDLYLIHLPVSFSDEGLYKNPPERQPQYENGAAKTVFIDPLDTWREMEKLVDDGLAKAIGLSNFNKEQLLRIYEKARIKPANLQIEVHAWFPQYDLVEFCQKRGISITAYAPLGSPGRPVELNLGPPSTPLLDEPCLKEIAIKHSKTCGQVLLRNLLQRGTAVVPKSSNPDRMKSNLEIMDFELSEEDMEMIKGLNKELRLFSFNIYGKQNFYHPFFPWPELVDKWQPPPEVGANQ